MSKAVDGWILWNAAAAFFLAGSSAAHAEMASTSPDQLSAVQSPATEHLSRKPHFDDEAPIAHARAWASIAALRGGHAAGPDRATGDVARAKLDELLHAVPPTGSVAWGMSVH